MRKLVRPFVALVVLSLGVVIVPSAQAAYMPTAGAAFNDPNGSRSQQTVLMDQIIGAVNNVPSGSIIRVVAYSFDYQPVADALIAAKKRGAQVRLLIDSHAETAQIRQLRSAFGTGTSDGTYLRTCKFSCMANTDSFIHSKLYLFSRTGGATHVSMNSSANPAETGVSKSWNNTYTTVGDKTLYDANVDNFNDMLPDKTNTDYYHTVDSTPYKEYFFPRAGSTKSSDTLYNILNDVSCPSSIKLTTYFWTNLRVYLADKLADLKTKGCSVEVIYPDGSGSQDTIESGVTTELRSGNIPTWNTRLFEDNPGLYVHNKLILINGTYQGVANQKIVYATSQNLTMTSLRESNEVMLRIPIPAVYDAYAGNFANIKAHAVQIIPAGKTAAGLESARETTSGKAPKDNSPDPDE
jgi:phosphatidylserine/phosphatidylglycerophosphate/cardiolipin synthase-like enzyme